MTTCRLVGRYQRFGRICCLRHQGRNTSPFRQTQYVPPLHWYPPTKLHGAIDRGAQYKPSYLLTYLLTPWCRVLEQLTGLQLVKKFPKFHGTRRFITALTSVRHLSLSWAYKPSYPEKNYCLINVCYLTARLITYTRRLFTENSVAIFCTFI